MKDEVTLYLADDHQIVIDGLLLLINHEKKLVVVGTATNGKQAYQDILFKKPDIAILDLRMPDFSGLQVIRSLVRQLQTKFIVLSMHNDKRYIEDVFNSGGYGYLLKNTGKEQLLTCISRVIASQKYFPNLDVVTGLEKERVLTPRELEILKMIIGEATTQQIAEQLALSPFTVETHRKNIWRKTNTKTIVGLVKYAIDHSIDFQ